MEKKDKNSDLLKRLGHRVRWHRKQHGMTLKELAAATGLSLRFVAQLEAGEGNIAVGRLALVAEALGVGIADLISDYERGIRSEIDQLLEGRSEAELKHALNLLNMAFGGRGRHIVGLLGLRGAGKTTVGGMLARRLKVQFWELDDRIEELAGLSLSEIFALHGESYYRRLEEQALIEVLNERKRGILALPGGIVGDADSFDMIKRNCLTIWLQADPEDHMNRVLMQGDRRPMANRPNALAELRLILAAREPLYEQADFHVQTSRLGLEKTVETILAELKKQGWF